tara:strand:+ start:557 stop:763 length:207 start_codon:yes stop_codon:yes gene_type:complete
MFDLSSKARNRPESQNIMKRPKKFVKGSSIQDQFDYRQGKKIKFRMTFAVFDHFMDRRFREAFFQKVV